MPTGNILIPNIGRKIAAVLRQQALTPAELPTAFLQRVGTSKHRYFTAAQTAGGETVAFYARLHQNPDAQRKFLTEITVLRRFNRITASFARAVPKLYHHGHGGGFEWFTREYIPGQALGHSRELQTTLPAGIAPQLADAIVGIGRLQPKKLWGKLPTFNPRYYRVAQQCFGLSAETGLPISSCQGIAALVEKNRHLLQRENRYLSHGDLNLGNILVANGRVRIVDWELAQRNNFAYDIGYLWVHLWEAPRTFRRQLMRRFLRSLKSAQHNIFPRLLPVVVAYLAIGGIPFRVNAREQKAELERRQRYHIALLQNCLGGFHKLINT